MSGADEILGDNDALQADQEADYKDRRRGSPGRGRGYRLHSSTDYATLPIAGLYLPIWKYDTKTLARDLSALRLRSGHRNHFLADRQDLVTGSRIHPVQPGGLLGLVGLRRAGFRR